MVTTNIGIIGSGQLAMMLIEASKNIASIRCFLYATDKNDPAVRFADEDKIIYGTLSEEEKLTTFLRHVDIATFESEFVSVPVLKKCSEGSNIKFLPNLKAIEILQDKLSQKEVSKTAGIPTACWIKKDQSETAEQFLNNIKKSYNGFAVLKWSRNGYDGKGNLFIHPETSLSQIEKFIHEGAKKGAVTFAEELIKFKREVAIIACRSANGAIIFYPFVESVQNEGVCQEVFGHVDTSIDIVESEKIKTGLKNLMTDLDYVGTLGCELFETTNGKLMLNELAPRVHNTGHYTQDTDCVSQFENHLRCIAGLELENPKIEKLFLMRNILGKPLEVYAESAVPVALNNENIHWYYKTKISYRRKLGHVNIVGGEIAEMRTQAIKIEELWVKKAYK